MHPCEERGRVAIEEIDSSLRQAVKSELAKRNLPIEELQRQFAVNKADVHNIITGRQVALSRLIIFAGALGCEMKFMVTPPEDFADDDELEVEEEPINTKPVKKKKKAK
ncbi:hypothetical protein LU11_gp324 [Pseudomonas phage Lu11]|uniref:hypothetical protein n=1 Tax=Pseudomonas phage Lu11 TaxID=1161927 RepID=UPI00025F186E|nr:hypothetical protein LU11_gp324 [Pseudomonas phage Lu11]AFH14855.1 hypothetical protein Lu11_0317 [Pseudomonas phage Lu11]